MQQQSPTYLYIENSNSSGSNNNSGSNIIRLKRISSTPTQSQPISQVHSSSSQSMNNQQQPPPPPPILQQQSQSGYLLSEDARKSRSKFSEFDVKALIDLVVLFGKDVRKIRKYKPFDSGKYSERQIYDKIRAIKRSQLVPVYPDETAKKRARLSLGISEDDTSLTTTQNASSQDEDYQDDYTADESEDEQQPIKKLKNSPTTTNTSTFSTNNNNNNNSQQAIKQMPYKPRSRFYPFHFDEPILISQPPIEVLTNVGAHDSNDISPQLSSTTPTTPNSTPINKINNKFPPHPIPHMTNSSSTNTKINTKSNSYHSLLTPNTQSFYKYETSKNLFIFNPHISSQREKITITFENDILTVLISNSNIFDFIKEKSPNTTNNNNNNNSNNGSNEFREDTQLRIDFPHPGKHYGPPRKINELPNGITGLGFIFERIQEGNLDFLDCSNL